MRTTDDNFEMILGPFEDEEFDRMSISSCGSSCSSEPEFPLETKPPSHVYDTKLFTGSLESSVNNLELWYPLLDYSMPTSLDKENTTKYNFHPDPQYPLVSCSLTRPIKKIFGQNEIYLVVGESCTSFSDTFCAFQIIARKISRAIDPKTVSFAIIDKSTGVVQSIFVSDGHSLSPGSFAGLEIDQPINIKPSLFINVCDDPDHVSSFSSKVLQDVPVVHVLGKAAVGSSSSSPLKGPQGTIAPTVYSTCDERTVVPMDLDLLKQVHPMRLVQILQRPGDLPRDVVSAPEYFSRDVGCGFIKSLKWDKLPEKQAGGNKVFPREPMVSLWNGLVRTSGAVWTVFKVCLFLLALWNVLYENKLVSTGPQSLVRTNQTLTGPVQFSVPPVPTAFVVQPATVDKGDLGNALMIVCDTTNSVAHATIRSCRDLIWHIQQLTNIFRLRLLDTWNLARLHTRILVEQVDKRLLSRKKPVLKED